VARPDGDADAGRVKGLSSRMRVVDQIWHVRGVMPLDPSQSQDDVFGRLDVVFQEKGTSYTRDDNTLVFHKKDPLSQDKMASFDSGCLQIVDGPSGSELRYELKSRALLACFLAPLLFLAIAGFVESLRIQGFIFAGLFVLLYAGGRVIEPWQVRSLFRKSLFESCDSHESQGLVSAPEE
jgi:hypothetical protein